jgi:hypothetical protein
MKRIKLRSGNYALVDNEDFDYLNQWGWSESWNGYAVRGEHNGGHYITIRMHRIIAKTPQGKFTDHINHNTLDNRRSNLRICDKAQNGYNRGKPITNSSGYRGVQFHHAPRPLSKPWKALMQVRGKKYFLGYFKTSKEAAIAWNQKAKELHGEFARLNKI